MTARAQQRSPLARVLGRLFWPDAPTDLTGTVVVCHEWLVTLGGSDKVAAEIANAIDADYVAVLAASPDLVAQLRIKAPVVESRLGKYVRNDRRWQLLLPLMPLIWRAFDARRARLLVTSSHAFVNCARGPEGRVVSYCHTPMRYAWEWQVEAGRIPGLLRRIWPTVARGLRSIDRRASRSVTRYVSNSANVRERIARCYQRDAVVVHPPIDLDWWTPDHGERGEFVLVAGRMVAYKRPELAIEAARSVGLRVVVAGSGPALARIGDRDGVEVVDSPRDEVLRSLFRRCRMLAFPAIEDFGMIPIEAQACGAPVVGMASGGTLETVRHGDTGLLVDEQTPAAFAVAMRQIANEPFEVLPHATVAFGRERFVEEIRAVIAEVTGA
jgi:glycosyltransferase involved in cell wall biosynthesis